MKFWERVLTGIVYMLVNVAVGWFVVWLFKPDLTSETVWFFVLLYAYLASDIAKLEDRVQEVQTKEEPRA